MNLQKVLVKSVFLGSVMTIFCVTPALAAIKGSVNGDNINIRASADTGADVLGNLNQNDTVVIQSEENGWYRISFDGEAAYVFGEFVNISEADGLVNDNQVNYRAGASQTSEILGQASKGTAVTVKGVAGDFYKVSIRGTEAYIHTSYVDGAMLSFVPQIENNDRNIDVYGLVTADTGLKLRQNPSADASVLSVLPDGDVLDVLEVGMEWVKVEDYSGNTGYVSAEFLSIRKGEKPARSGAAQGKAVADFAVQHLGTPYAWGGTNLKSGVDCSGFVYSVYKNFGVTLNRSSRDMVRNGVEVSKDAVEPGDLVFFTNGGSSISHVGIYIGNGQYVHSSTYNTGVIISSLSSARGYCAATRIFR